MTIRETTVYRLKGAEWHAVAACTQPALQYAGAWFGLYGNHALSLTVRFSVRFDSWFHFHCKAMFPVRFTYIHGQCALVSDDQAESIAL